MSEILPGSGRSGRQRLAGGRRGWGSYRAQWLLLALAMAAGCGHRAQPASLPLGLWVWRDTDFNTGEARRDLLAFCQHHGIVHLDVHTRLTEVGTGYELREGVALGQLVEEAGQRGITVSALRGAPRMFMEESRDQTLAELRALIAFDASLAPGPGLLGIKYDVEPYATPEWRQGGDSRRQVIADYLATLARIRAVLDSQAPDLVLATDVPFWWDKDEYVLPFAGRQLTFSAHVQSLADYVAVMSYRRSASQVIGCVEAEVAMARELGRGVCPSLETGELSSDQHISFFGTPPAAMQTCVDSLRAHYGADPAVRLIMLHHYGTVRAYLEGAGPLTPAADTRAG